MNSKNRRGLDLFAGVFFILFSLWSFLETFKIPMKDTYGGVSNVWYVSPALMPLLVNSGLLLLGISLIVFSIKHGALEYIKEWKNHALSQMLSTYFASTEFRRFLFIAMLFLVEVYIFIPHVDFYLSMALFLFIFISFFHLESKALNRITVPLFFGFSALVALLKLVGVMNMINRRFQYIFDAVVLVILIAMMVSMARCVRSDAEQKKESRKVRNIALLGPFLLIVLFKYLLLIPMPVEGGIISLLNLVYYSFR
ncbi:MAG: hypothetical protein PHO09_14490 [Sphaerochaeta sp.]|nr:hypothetical protein [Sphaerochaeta sp.]